MRMNAQCERLFRSQAVSVYDYRCRETPGRLSAPEVQNRPEINFTRTGFFNCRIGKKQYVVETDVVLLLNAGSERVVLHGDDVRDTCTIFRFSENILEEARKCYYRSGIFTAMDPSAFPLDAVASTPGLDHLHSQILLSLRSEKSAWAGLQTETLAMELLAELFRRLYGTNSQPPSIENGLRERHLETIERAKNYIQAGFEEDLSLTEIARNCFVSEFHFSRLFKKFTLTSPYQYLLEIRLKHAALLLLNTRLSVTEVCFASGFQSFPHFISMFKARYGKNPSEYRRYGK
jgi:AraC-like DNA-binding protein